ncbi:TolC family protein [Tepidanaerobacter syntrophicus]|uniref:Outer membrane efflux protein n=1 Tax=Tepidanaerobacter syntrophicus TaxID=224999 RepID=A0A0U9HHT0_9FIRM|nr:TolC family protein [Tepidanaerobacter syntrophicus]GAQ25460.1 outer membrane efflux protein [Tepidanaerobacter syntrophicus]
MQKALLSKMAIFVLVLSLMISSIAFAQENSDNEVLSLSVEDAVKIAEENNQQIKLSQLALQKAQLARKELVYQEKKVKEEEDMLGREIISGTFEYQYAQDLGKKQADIGVDLAQRGIEVAIKGVEYGIEAGYYGALLAKENVAIAQAAVDRQQEMLRIAEAKYKAGTVAKTEVLNAQVQLTKAEGDLSKAKSSEEKAYITLKKLLGLPLDKNINLTDSFKESPENLDVTLDELIEQANSNRIDIVSAEGAFEIAKLDFELSSKAYPSNTFTYAEKEYAMEEAQLKLSNTKSSAEAEIRNTWLDFEDAKTNIPVLDKSLEVAQESLRIAKLSYEAGLVRSVDVTAAEDGLKQVQLQRLSAIYNYNLARLKLENSVYFSTAGNASSSSM